MAAIPEGAGPRSAPQVPSVYSTQCHKRGYTPDDAFAAFVIARLILNEYPGRPVEQGAYRCATCGMIHLTSMKMIHTPLAMMAARLW